MNALMATIPSPPGRFSTTTGLFQRAASLSANSRAPMSVPLPGPSGKINLTVRWGQLCAGTGVAPPARMSDANRLGTIRRAMRRNRRFVCIVALLDDVVFGMLLTVDAGEDCACHHAI